MDTVDTVDTACSGQAMFHPVDYPAGGSTLLALLVRLAVVKVLLIVMQAYRVCQEEVALLARPSFAPEWLV